MIASSDPGAAIGSSQKFLDLRASEKIDLATNVMLVRDGKDTLKVNATFRFMKASKLTE